MFSFEYRIKEYLFESIAFFFFLSTVFISFLLSSFTIFSFSLTCFFVDSSFKLLPKYSFSSSFSKSEKDLLSLIISFSFCFSFVFVLYEDFFSTDSFLSNKISETFLLVTTALLAVYLFI